VLRPVDALPSDRRISAVHDVPFTDIGSILMAWDRDEHRLTTIGGRLEAGESLRTALDREAVEEAGVLLGAVRLPIAAFLWPDTLAYTVWVVATSPGSSRCRPATRRWAGWSAARRRPRRSSGSPRPNRPTGWPCWPSPARRRPVLVAADIG